MPTTILELIDLRSFSSIWYWLVVGALWARAINAPMSVPLDLLRAADRGEVEASREVAQLCAIWNRRHASTDGVLAVLPVAIWAFALTVLVISGLVYGVEFAQAVLLIAAPMVLVSTMTNKCARRLPLSPGEPEERHKMLFRLKNKIQALGLLSVFFSAIWGMYHNLSTATF